MATRTARGTAQSKASGTTLTVASFTLPKDHSLQVGIGCENSAGPPTSVAMNGRPLKRKENANNATASLNCSMWIKARAAVPQTGTLVATWSSSINARAMFASTLDAPMRIDETISASDASTTTPNTGTSAALATETDFAICAFASKGPSGDTAATGQQIGGSTATLGQRIGTTGAVAATNVTIQETYLQLASASAVAGNLSGVTSRRWASGLITVRPTIESRAAIAPTDLQFARDVFDGKGTPIPHENMAWYYNEEDDRWEVYDASSDVGAGTLVAYYTVDSGWTEV